MSFTNGKPFIATMEQCNFAWCSVPNGKHFRCYLCGYHFKEGDTVRCQYTNDIPGAGGNPLVCTNCDGTKEEIVQEMREKYNRAKSDMWWFCK
jgi:hypothetical protein